MKDLIEVKMKVSQETIDSADAVAKMIKSDNKTEAVAISLRVAELMLKEHSKDGEIVFYTQKRDKVSIKVNTNQ